MVEFSRYIGLISPSKFGELRPGKGRFGREGNSYVVKDVHVRSPRGADTTEILNKANLQFPPFESLG